MPMLRDSTVKRARTAIRLWTGVVVAGLVYGVLLVGNRAVVWPSIGEYLTRGEEARVPRILWGLSNLLTFVAPFAVQTLAVLLAISAWMTWHIRRERRKASKNAGVFTVMGSSAALAAIALGLSSLPWAASQVAFATFCKPTTLESVLSPDGRYQAAVVETSCDDIRRQVILTRWPLHFRWAAVPILVLNERPALNLSWSGRTLTITGSRTRRSIAHPLPDPWCCWGSTRARYVGPQ
jgi:hypothetical protein